jgi:FKBP-type peptidyl-prolyl cis-trans isomerase 2
MVVKKTTINKKYLRKRPIRYSPGEIKESKNMQKLKIAILLVLLVMFNVAAAGCLSEESKPTPKLDISLIGSGHKIFAGDTTTYFVVVDNNRDDNDTVTLTITDFPSGWEVSINQTEFNITKRESFAVFLVVKAKEGASTGEHSIKIRAQSQLFTSKKTLTIKTRVISDSGERVIIGDKVAVDYVGYLETYRVFDTSLEKIALETNLRKTSDFSTRGNYEELLVYVGPVDPDTKDNYISTVQGFWEAIEGMKKGQSRTVTFEPEKGYGNYLNATLNVTEEITMFETFTHKEFSELYPGERPFESIPFTHHFWDWNASIDYVNETLDLVRIQHEPDLNQEVTAYGWDAHVTYKNQSDNGGEGRIIVTHSPEVGDEGIYLDFPAEVQSVEGGEIGIRYNNSPHNLGNEVLTFDITLIDIQG